MSALGKRKADQKKEMKQRATRLLHNWLRTHTGSGGGRMSGISGRAMCPKNKRRGVPLAGIKKFAREGGEELASEIENYPLG